LHKILVTLFSFLLTFQSATASTDYLRVRKKFAAELRLADRLSIARRADLALDNLIKLAAWELKRKGHSDESEALLTEWYQSFKGVIPTIVVNLDNGNMALADVPEIYAPMSEWLAEWGYTLKATLGPEAFEFLHLDDIQIINWGTPVVLRLSMVGDAAVDFVTYDANFNPWCGVVAYWSAFGTCMAITLATGWVYACTPLGMGAEYITSTFIAPIYSYRVWESVYADL
jgi:hypothetical protein